MRFPSCPQVRPANLFHVAPAGVLLVAALLTVGAARAASQPGPVEPARPEAVESCVPIGVTLALFDSGAPVISIVPAFDPAGGVPIVEVRRPMFVGVCAEVQAFWRPAAAGTVEATLTLASVGSDGSATMLGGDALQETRSGVAHHAEELKATLAPQGPGTLDLVAELQVRATNAIGALTTDTLHMPLRIVVVDGIATGALSGTVLDARGQPLAGAHVRAEHTALSDFELAVPARRVPILPIQPAQPSVEPNIGRSDPPSGLEAVTDSAGRFWMEPPVGSYRIEASAPSHAPQWYDGTATRADADVVLVDGGAVITGLDFTLRPATSPTPAPTPDDKSVDLSGRVTNLQGEPVAGAEVWAFMRGQVPGGDSWKSVAICCTKSDGSYRFRQLEAMGHDVQGEVLVSAHADGYQRAWFRGATTPYGAQLLAPRPDRPAMADLTLAPLGEGVVRGFVSRSASVMVGYPVMADGTVGSPTAMAFYDGHDRLKPRMAGMLRLAVGADAALGEPPFLPYSLYLPSGRYVIGGTENWRADITEGRSRPHWWWPGVADPMQARVIDVVAGRAVEGIDLNP